MILLVLVDNESPDQTVQADLNLCCLHMLEDMFLHRMACIIYTVLFPHDMIV